MNKSDQQKKHTEKFRDVSYFTRWVNELDEKDKILNPDKRTIKWVLTLAVLFLLFAFSFIFFPPVKLDKGKIQPIQNDAKNQLGQSLENANPESFDLPVDSFENQLKHKIHGHQKLPEKK